MKKVFGLELVFALCLHLPTAAIPPQQIAVKSFATWCQERNSVAVTTRHTDIQLMYCSKKPILKTVNEQNVSY
jgi:hypothetical protein